MINSCSCSLYTYINNEISPYVKIVRIYMRSYTFDFVPWCFLKHSIANSTEESQ